MATIRMPEGVWSRVHHHLFDTPSEHFAFLRAGWSFSGGGPVFFVRDAILIPDDAVTIDDESWEIDTAALVATINAAARSGDALIEVHNHGGVRPRFSRTDRAGFREFPPYVLDSLPGRPYAATVWGDSTVYGEYFLADGRTGVIDSVAVTGARLRQLVSRDDDLAALPEAADRQVPWFGDEGQRQLGRLRAGVVGAGGTGSHALQQLAYLGVRDYVVVEDDTSETTNMNRLVTATAADVGTPKGILARRLVKSVAPDARVQLIAAKLQTAEAIDALKGVDVILGCVDNDGARLVLTELAVAYTIPYFDLAVGIEVEDGSVVGAGGRVVAILPGGPCLLCCGEIDLAEARYHLGSPAERVLQVERGYVHGLDVHAPAVVSLNGAIAATAINELSVLISGLRPVTTFLELDLLGEGRGRNGQWLTPRRIAANPGCLICSMAGSGDMVGLERYAGH